MLARKNGVGDLGLFILAFKNKLLNKANKKWEYLGSHTFSLPETDHTQEVSLRIHVLGSLKCGQLRICKPCPGLSLLARAKTNQTNTTFSSRNSKATDDTRVNNITKLRDVLYNVNTLFKNPLMAGNGYFGNQ